MVGFVRTASRVFYAVANFKDITILVATCDDRIARQF